MADNKTYDYKTLSEIEFDQLNKYYTEQMLSILTSNEDDEEGNHIVADAILCEILETLGFKELVELYEKIDKWYA
jgi:hypothetical protein